MRLSTLLPPILLPPILLLLAAPAAAAQVHPRKVLSGTVQTERFLLRYRPGSRAAASADYVAYALERELAEVCAKLMIDDTDRFEVFLYDSPGELGRLTGVVGAGGFAAGTELHIPYDNDQTRYHELVHVVAAQLPVTGPEPRSTFFAEGLANSTMVFTHHLHCHDVAAFERQRDGLPPLADLVADDAFYAYQREHPDFFGYDVAASYLLFLTESHGIERVKRYCGGAPAKEVFGVTLAGLEKAWHERLDRIELRAESRDLMESRSGGTAGFAGYSPDADARLPEDLLRTAPVWRDLTDTALEPDATEHWSRDGATVVARAPDAADWSFCRLPGPFGDGAVRATLRVTAGSCARIGLGPDCVVELVGNGTFLFDGHEYVDHDEDECTASDEVWDLVLLRRGGQAQVWMDGYLVLEGSVGTRPADLSLGLLGAQCRFEGLRWRPLP